MMWAIIWTMGNIHFVYLTWSIRAKPIVVDCGHLSAIFPFNISYCQHFTMFPGSARGLIKMKNKKLYTLSHYMVWKMIRSAPVLSAAPSTYLCITISIAILILSLFKFIFVQRVILVFLLNIFNIVNILRCFPGSSRGHLKMKNDISIAIIILSLSIFIFGQRAGKQTFVYWLYWLLGHGRTNIQPSSYNKSLTFSFFEFFDQNNRTNELGSWCRNQSELVPVWYESSPGLNDYNNPSLSNCLDVRGWLCNIILPVAGNWARICRLWLDLPTAASTPHVPGQDRSWYVFSFCEQVHTR